MLATNDIHISSSFNLQIYDPLSVRFHRLLSLTAIPTLFHSEERHLLVPQYESRLHLVKEKENACRFMQSANQCRHITLRVKGSWKIFKESADIDLPTFSYSTI